jgi:phosphohistidine phosphatase
MTTRLWILRHGEAERNTQRDSERSLTARGESDARAAGEYLAKAAAPTLRVFASPYRRAQQTAQAALIALPNKQLITVHWLIPDDDPLAVVAELTKLLAMKPLLGIKPSFGIKPSLDNDSPFDTEILLVSHQPLVTALVGLLVSGDYRAGPAMGTASLAELELPVIAQGCGKLLSLRHAPDYSKSAN